MKGCLFTFVIVQGGDHFSEFISYLLLFCHCNRHIVLTGRLIKALTCVGGLVGILL